MRALPEASIDAVVCDPPYELAFMGKAWDGTGLTFRPETWREVLRVLKPGGYLLAFSATRTYHRMTCAIEDAGFEIRDCIGWHYGSGFPKSLDVARSIEGAKVGRGARYSAADPNLSVDSGAVSTPGKQWKDASARTMSDGEQAWTGGKVNVTDPAALSWQGWGTALKPAWEPVVVARKPLEGTVAANVLKHGTGAMNIDGGRVEGGRWPANVILSHDPDCGEDGCAPGCPCAAMDAQSDSASRFFNNLPIEADDLVPFFYAAKASRKERNAGLPEETPCTHPTVKPVAVMRHLVRLVTRKGGVVLDPFMGSGTTGVAAVLEGLNFIGIDLSDEYLTIARARIAHHGGSPETL
jgi:site-specific DNA-methyltransferase (adenine-specific)